jgi:hypothetical protein
MAANAAARSLTGKIALVTGAGRGLGAPLPVTSRQASSSDNGSMIGVCSARISGVSREPAF